VLRPRSLQIGERNGAALRAMAQGQGTSERARIASARRRSVGDTDARVTWR